MVRIHVLPLQQLRNRATPSLRRNADMLQPAGSNKGFPLRGLMDQAFTGGSEGSSESTSQSASMDFISARCLM